MRSPFRRRGLEFEFGEGSDLYKRDVNLPLAGFSYVECSEDGETEYVFIYKKEIPWEKLEPDLFFGAKVKELSVGETHLRYRDTNEMIILITEEENRRFLGEFPHLAKNGRFSIRAA
jgi:hypothetical protein